MKLYWNHIERAVEIGRLTDWYLERPRIDHDETDMWIFCIGFISIGWEMAR